jgi:starch phosphorylase
MDARSFRDVLEKKAIPLFYDRDRQGIPRGWVAMEKHALRTLAWRFNASRMLLDYAISCYLPAAGGLTSLLPMYK